MQELRLVTAIDEGARLLLRALDGSEYALPLDEKLKAAVRGDRVRLGQLEIELDTPLRPRDIQARIRAGESAADVAEASGIPLERVRRYEGPVLAEREHMAAMARRTAMHASIPNERPAPLLGDVLAQRLRERGIDPDTASWDSWRREDGRWQVAVAHRPAAAHAPAESNPAGSGDEVGSEDSAGATERALFLLDPTRRTVSPDNDNARLLVAEQQTLAAEAMAGLRPRMSGLADEGGDQDAAIDIGSGVIDRASAGGAGPRGGRAAKGSPAARHGREQPGRAGDILDLPAPAADIGPGIAGAGASRTDGTSALGPGVGQRPDRGVAAYSGDDGLVVPRVGVAAMGGLVPLAPVPPRRPLQRNDPDRDRPARRSRRPHVPASATAPIRRPSLYEERLIGPAERPPSGPRPRRASVPSWDEILFGTRTRNSD